MREPLSLLMEVLAIRKEMDLETTYILNLRRGKNQK